LRLLSSVLPFLLLDPPAATQSYTLSLHDALPICARAPEDGREDAHAHDGVALGCRDENGAVRCRPHTVIAVVVPEAEEEQVIELDRKSTRLNSSHVKISYAVFCLKKKKKKYSQLI